MIQWENSRSTEQRHEHTLRTNERGQDVCMSCSKIVIKPITSSDDPRLENAGLHRSGGQTQESPFPAPLSIQLISMYNESWGDFPVAPYLITVLEEHGRRGGDPDWGHLANKS